MEIPSGESGDGGDRRLPGDAGASPSSRSGRADHGSGARSEGGLGIGLTIVVYPWPLQMSENDRHSRQVEIWQSFCKKNKCKNFINTYPAFFAVKDARTDWYNYLFIQGDVHYSAAGNRVLYDALVQKLQ